MEPGAIGIENSSFGLAEEFVGTKESQAPPQAIAADAAVSLERGSGPETTTEPLSPAWVQSLQSKMTAGHRSLVEEVKVAVEQSGSTFTLEDFSRQAALFQKARLAG